MERSHFNDERAYEGFSFVFTSQSCFAAAQKAFEEAKLARQTAVVWDSAEMHEDHVYLRWKVPATHRAARAWAWRLCSPHPWAEGHFMTVVGRNGGYTAAMVAEALGAKQKQGASGPSAKKTEDEDEPRKESQGQEQEAAGQGGTAQGSQEPRGGRNLVMKCLQKSTMKRSYANYAVGDRVGGGVFGEVFQVFARRYRNGGSSTRGCHAERLPAAPRRSAVA